MPLYFLTCVLLFWIPGLALFAGLWRGLAPADRAALWWTLVVMTPLTILMEFIYLKADIWSFSGAHDPLLGLTLFGAPIEEFAFWFGTTPFVLGIYLTVHRMLPAAWLIVPPRPERRAKVRRPRARTRRG